MNRTNKPRPAYMRYLNVPLVLGLICVGVLLLVSIAGPMIAPNDPLEVNFIMQTPDGEFVTPPFEPGEISGLPLGTDFDGRDLWSRLLWAVRPTLVLTVIVSLVRLVIGVILGFIEGWYSGLVSDLVGSARRIASGVPILIVAILVIYILGFQFTGGIFIVALTLTGWAGTTKVIAERARLIKGEAYIEASRALGARDSRLLFKHLIPQVRTLILVTWAFEMSATLLQLAELGFLGFFIGGGAIRLVPDGNTPAMISVLIAGAPELGQMLSAGWDNFFLVPWMTVIGGTAFFFAIFSFMMLGDGLKRLYADRQGRPIQMRLLKRRTTAATAPANLRRVDVEPMSLPMPEAREIIRL